MRTRIITTTEIKKILGITGSSNDAVIEIWNDTITDVLCQMLDVHDLAVHTVTNERVEISECDPYKMYLSDFPVDILENITLKDEYNNPITGFTFGLDPKEIKTVRLYDESGKPRASLYDRMLVSYTAGYTVKDTLEVLSIADLAEKTITVTIAGVTTTYTFKASGATENQINVGVNEAATASNIATVLGGAVNGAVVTLPLGSSVTLGSATTAQFTIVNASIPPSLKMAVALMVGGTMADKDKVKGIQSYTIGTKTVTFRSGADFNTVNTVLSQYIPFSKKTMIMGI